METAAQEVSNDVNLQDNGGRVLSMDVDKDFSGKPQDLAKDIAMLQAKMTPQVPQAPAQTSVVEPPPVEVTPGVEPKEPAQPEPTPQAAATPEVPAKFQDKDGNLDQDKLAKSTESAEAQLKKYLDLEKQLRQKANEVARQKQGYPLPEPKGQEPAPGQTPATTPAPDSFEARIDQDIKREGLGPVLARLFTAASEHGSRLATSEIEGIKTEAVLSQRSRELSAIGKVDPWVLSEKGMERLAQIRQDRPHLLNHPEAWTEAYKVHLGEEAYRNRTGGLVQTPNPTAPRVPPAPIQAAPRSAGVSESRFDSKEAVEAHLARLSPEQQDAFWASKGFAPLNKKGR